MEGKSASFGATITKRNVVTCNISDMDNLQQYIDRTTRRTHAVMIAAGAAAVINSAIPLFLSAEYIAHFFRQRPELIAQLVETLF